MQWLPSAKLVEVDVQFCYIEEGRCYAGLDEVGTGYFTRSKGGGLPGLLLHLPSGPPSGNSSVNVPKRIALLYLD
ncbi:hypothetical protein HPB52_017145 [Rhipicephalus sanguineus]|uniref:Uncharacterized protein n=1 Tax=Rhipicephalus sanguineus TaxID=34632 RepID=A0A9D4PWW8_RHISA|nr:hypothetical protein HPB52_017145 [Rhipicephalus sanguineus]